jgi:hypothetical protein
MILNLKTARNNPYKIKKHVMLALWNNSPNLAKPNNFNAIKVKLPWIVLTKWIKVQIINMPTNSQFEILKPKMIVRAEGQKEII